MLVSGFQTSWGFFAIDWVGVFVVGVRFGWL